MLKLSDFINTFRVDSKWILVQTPQCIFLEGWTTDCGIKMIGPPLKFGGLCFSSLKNGRIQYKKGCIFIMDPSNVITVNGISVLDWPSEKMTEKEFQCVMMK